MQAAIPYLVFFLAAFTLQYTIRNSSLIPQHTRETTSQCLKSKNKFLDLSHNVSCVKAYSFENKIVNHENGPLGQKEVN